MWLKAPPPSDQNVQFPLEMSYFPTFARLYGILSSGHMIRIEEMAESEKVWLDTNSVQSFIGLPIQVDGKFWGSVCFVDWLIARQWQENECNILSLLTTMLGNAIARRNDWEELERQERFTRHVLSALPVQIFVKDAEGRFVMANDEYSIAGNKVSGPVLGSTSSELFGSESAKQYDEEDQYVIRTGQVYVSPVEPYFVPEGKERWRQIEKSPIRDANGKVTHIVGIQYDLTEQMEKNEELRKAKEAAEAATRAKSAFLANMSHEIRTPMNAVVGMTSLLTQTNLDDEQRECIETIRNSGEALLGILNKILDFSKIESEQLELEHQPFALIECLEQTLELFAHKAYEKGLELFLSITPGVPTYIYGDLVRLRQILSNLIDNAVKFTDTGDIVVSVSVEQNDMSHIYFSVSDNGIGLSQEEQQRLFLSFSQVDSSITRRYGGTGLGLAISKRLCELMGGRIWVSSSEQQGTTFHFTIAFEPVVEQPIWPGNHSPLSRKRILLIDGHPLIRKELRDLLELWGALVSVASSVSQATQLLTGPFYHLVIADLHMALTGGLKSALENQLERTTSETQILLLTKVGDPFNPAELQKSNNYSTLTKPIKPTELLARITSLTLDTPNTRTVRSRTQPVLPINDAVKILLVEDNEINRKVALRLLQRLGYQAEVTANGEEAVNLLSRQRFDIVLMDAHMPVMGGLEATRRIRTLLPQPEQPYIIGITADALASFREECLDAGMDDYITKPMGIEDLSQALTRSLSAIALRKEPA